MKNRKLFIVGIAALGINLIFAGVVLGESLTTTANVTRTGNLSFFSIPTSFDFGTTAVPRVPPHLAVFSDRSVTTGSLPIGKRLTVEDTRSAGGFTVTLSANSFFTDVGSDKISIGGTTPFITTGIGENDNLRIVTTPLLDGITGGTPANCPGTAIPCTILETGFQGPETTDPTKAVHAFVNTASNNFGDEATFTGVTNNVIDADTESPAHTAVPTSVLDGSLALPDGRIGHITMGVSSMLYIPVFQAAGQYAATLTWTLADSTN